MVEQETRSTSGNGSGAPAGGAPAMPTMKVYELAKELGMDSISLLDRLKGLNIRVKNHMSELGPEDVRQARSALGKKEASSGGTSAPKAKKAVTRKKASDAPAAAASTAQAASTTQAASAAPAAAGKAPVLRRRVREGGETETVVTNPSTAPTPRAPREEPSHAQASDDSAAHAAEPVEAVSPETEDNREASAEEAVSASAETADSGSEAAPSMEASSAEAQATPSPTASASSPATPSTTTPGTTALKAGPTVGQPQGLKPSGRPPIVLPPRPVAPRRSILTVVEAAPVPIKVIKPAPVAPRVNPLRGTQVQDKDGFRITKISKENLDAMVEEEAAKKRGLPGGGRAPEIRPEDVRFADYRKKEMVFLPKRKRIPVGKELKRTQVTETAAHKKVVQMGDTITVQDLANQMSLKAIDVVRKLMGMGQMVNVHATIDFDTATLVATEFKFEVRNTAFKEETLIDKTPTDAPDKLQWRPPVVTIMGHVDHGKTSLLDSIRSANVAGGEAGGITQHIGAYTVEQDGRPITFIDTPGHEAFTVMRARGANVTDIVILVVAADDGVMPQTREALSHAKAAGVPIIVAMNKIDKPAANPEKIKQQLAELDLLAEDWGGQTMFIPVSATKKTGLDKLLEAILLNAEVLDLKANPEARAHGSVLEARLEKGRGPVVSVLVNRGTLRVGDAIVAGSFSGKVRAMIDDKGNPVSVITPGLAAEVLGFEGVPAAGEKFDSPATESDARDIAENRSVKHKASQATTSARMTMETLFANIKAGNMKELGVILKADVFGSVEAVRDSIQKLSNDQVKVKVIHAAAGGITESDVLLATASNALIVGFNVRPETKARQLAEAEHIEIKCYSIIYELIDEMRKSMAGLLDKKKVEKFLGRAEVRQTFSVPKLGMVAGSAVIDGKIVRGANVRLLRDSRIIYEGKMTSLRRFKDDAKEVATGYECGIGLENYNDLKPGDVIEAYMIEMIAPELNPASSG